MYIINSFRKDAKIFRIYWHKYNNNDNKTNVRFIEFIVNIQLKSFINGLNLLINFFSH